MMRHNRWAVGCAFSLILALYNGVVYAQAMDPTQLEHLGQIQDSQDQRRVSLEVAQQQAAQRAAQARVRQRQQDEAYAARIAAAQRARAETDWQDDRQYREASRAIALQKQQLELKMLESRVSHEDEFVKADLAQKQAQTEQLRQAAQGDVALKTDLGQAAKMAQRHWWEQ
ncbi:MAG: DUF5384 family protein [Bombella apis]|nr:DUF5384 family protein [Bombella apis]